MIGIELSLVRIGFVFPEKGIGNDNHAKGEQFALEGLSDSYNVVAFFEKFGWGVRAAYNWRDEFLASRFDGAGASPMYTEPYGQIDLNISYSPTDNLSFQLEAINLTDEIQRLHGRAQNEAAYVTQLGTRYMIGARYTFGR